MYQELYNVTFNGNNLNSINGVELINHDFNSLPERQIKIFKIARRNLSIITSSEYSSKTIPVYLEVCSGSRQETEETLTFVKSLLQAQNAPLVVSQGGDETRYTSTMNEFNIAWDGVTALVTVVFIASDPIGRNTDQSTLYSVSGVTAAVYNSSFTVAGSATAFPIITTTFNTVTGGTGQQFSVTNAQTGQGITFTADFTPGDILEINSETMQAELNGSLIDFTGKFPEFVAGANSIRITDTFTTRNYDSIGVYNPRLV